MKELCDEGDDVVCMLIGNKVSSFGTPSNSLFLLIIFQCDLHNRRVVGANDGKEFADKHKMLFKEVSALDATGIDEAFQEFIKCKIFYHTFSLISCLTCCIVVYIKHKPSRIEPQPVMMANRTSGRNGFGPSGFGHSRSSGFGCC